MTDLYDNDPRPEMDFWRTIIEWEGHQWFVYSTKGYLNSEALRLYFFRFDTDANEYIYEDTYTDSDPAPRIVARPKNVQNIIDNYNRYKIEERGWDIEECTFADSPFDELCFW